MRDMEEDSLLLNKGKPVYFEIPHRWVISMAAFLPVGGILLALFFALTYHYREATATHCRVFNWLPSFSATIGIPFPESSIWRMAIALMITQRLSDSPMQYVYHLRTAPPSPSPQSLPTISLSLNLNRSWTRYLPSFVSSLSACLPSYFNLNMINSVFLAIENFALLLLTMVSSTENFAVHEFGFVSFLIAAKINMIVTFILFSLKPQSQHLSYGQQNSITYSPISMTIKRLSFATQLLCIGSCVYFYLRHNSHCEPGVYSLFALSEYILVLANVIFHWTFTLDSPDAKVGFCMS